MGMCFPCFEGPPEDDDTPQDKELRRQQQAEAAERRVKSEESRGVKDPEALKKKQMRMQELEKKAEEQERSEDPGGGLKGWRWVENRPVTFSDWYYPDQVDHHIPKDTVFHVTDPRENLQPYNLSWFNCVVMNIFHPRQSTNWQTLNCHSLLFTAKKYYYICETPLMKNKTVKPVVQGITDQVSAVRLPYKIMQYSATTTCPMNWVFIQNKCWLLLQGKYNNYTFDQAKDDCKSRNGSIADISNLTIVKSYLTFIHHQEHYGNVWTETDSETSCVVYGIKPDFIQDDLARLELHSSDNCIKEFDTETYEFKDLNCMTNTKFCAAYWPDGCVVLSTSKKDATHPAYISMKVRCMPNNVLCVQDPIQIVKTCRVEYFPCNDGSCISPDLVCDTSKDCPSGDDEVHCDMSDYNYTCKDGMNVTISQYCDFVRDCSDGSDEEGCVYPSCSDGQFMCASGQCVDETSVCNGQYDGCMDHSDEWECNSKGKCHNRFACGLGTCTCFDNVNDGKFDCVDQTDEFYYTKVPYKTKFKADQSRRCLPEHAQCSERNIGCFNKGEVCVLGYDSRGVMKGCTSGLHLSNCSTFECPGRFKCPESYCIDMKLVCNGVIDCKNGEDEENCDDNRCPGLYRCGRENNCLEQSRMCNGELDCKAEHSDEKYCDVKECPSDCRCIGFYYKCTGSSDNYLKNDTLSHLARVIIISKGSGEWARGNFSFLRYSFLAILRLPNNNISLVCSKMFSNLSNLLTLDLSNNKLKTLSDGVFNDLKNLRNLILKGNLIKDLSSGSLHGVVSLKILDLSENEIEKLESRLFMTFGKRNNYSIYLKGNVLTGTPINIFQDIRPQYIETDNYRFCCFVNDTTNCLPKQDIYSSCDDLMANTFLQVFIWVVGFLALIGNVSVIVCRLVLGIRSPSEVCIFVLSFSDLLTGVYLIIIASADTHFRRNYIGSDEYWRNSVTCGICGVLSTLSSQLSSFLLLLITLDRFKHLVFPMYAFYYNRKHTIITCIILLVVCLLQAVIPLFGSTYFGSYYSKTPLCLAYDFTDLSDGWEYTLVVFIMVNLINCIVTLVCYIMIYLSVRRSGKIVDPTRQENIALAKTLFLLVLTDLVCWLPLIITNFAVMNGQKVSPDTAATLTVVILPINAALNPYLYTISSIRNAKVTVSSIRTARAAIGSIRNARAKGSPSTSRN